MTRTLAQSLHPSAPEARATHLSEGFVHSLVPGIVEDTNDPEGIGRVRVKAPLLDDSSFLPNDSDGWIPVVELFTNNSIPGGSHRQINPGTEVVMAALMGDPRQMVVLGCIPNRSDRPHPSLNRARGTHGEFTPGGVLQVEDDTDASRLISRPNGVVEHISGRGTVTIQTQDNARLQLTHDGNSLMDNPNAFTLLTTAGDVVQQSASGAQSLLTAAGNVSIQSAGLAQLNLSETVGRMIGPSGSIAGLLRQAKDKLSGFFEFDTLLQELKGLMEAYPTGEQFLSVINQMSDRIEAALATFEDGLSAIAQVAEIPVLDLGEKLLPQVDAFFEISSIVERAAEWVQLPIDALLQQLAEAGVSVDRDILGGLLHDPEHAIQYIAGAAAANGFRSVETIFGAGLHDNLPQVSAEFASIISERIRYNSLLLAIRREDEPPEEPDYEAAAYKIFNLLPVNIRSFVGPSQIVTLIKEAADERAAVGGVVGIATQGLAVAGLGLGQETSPVVEQMGQASRAVTAVTQGRLEELQAFFPDQAIADPVEAIKGVFEDIIQQAEGRLGPTIESLNSLYTSLPEGSGGAVVQASDQEARMTASIDGGGAVVRAAGAVAEMTGPGGLGGVVRAGAGVAEMIGPGGLSRVFAGPLGVGASSPWGGFSFGGAGGGFFGQGLMQIISQLDGYGSGLTFQPGELAIGNFSDGQQIHGLRIDRDEVSIQYGLNRLVVNSSGVFVNGYSLLAYWNNND